MAAAVPARRVGGVARCLGGPPLYTPRDPEHGLPPDALQDAAPRLASAGDVSRHGASCAP
jgi:hypothetical protein